MNASDPHAQSDAWQEAVEAAAGDVSTERTMGDVIDELIFAEQCMEWEGAAKGEESRDPNV